MISNDAYILKIQTFISHVMSLHDTKATGGDRKKLQDYYLDLVNEKWRGCYLYDVKELLQIDGFLWFGILFSFMFELDFNIWNSYVEKFHTQVISIRYLASLYAKIEKITSKDILRMIRDERIKLFFEITGFHNPIFSRGMLLHSWFVHYICEGVLPIYKGFSVMKDNKNDYFSVLQEPRLKLENAISQRKNTIILGREGTGKKSMLQMFVNDTNKELFILDMSTLTIPCDVRNKLLAYLVFGFLMHDCYGILMNPSTDNKKLYEEIYPLFKLWNLKYCVVTHVAIEYILFEEVISLPVNLAFNDIKRICEEQNRSLPKLSFHWNMTDMVQYLKGTSEVYDINSPFAYKIDKAYLLSDWIGDKQMHKQIELILYFIQHQYEIIENVQHPQKGIQILFHGASGTGKTMMAAIIAKELQQPLYRVDLSMVNDKYIGESEKHMEALLQQVEQKHGILLFDEADVLFAKRTKITSSNDRHANNMTAYLLQRLEDFDGLVILTSNFLHNFDDAFLRRMQFVVKFDKAQYDERVQKWKQLLQVIEYQGFSSEELANVSNLSLARMDHAFLMAVTLCHYEGKKVLERKHIYDGIANELMKQGEPLSQREGEYV